ncbi:MAG: succinate--CoA ligase subunit beta [gamma proteobacterium symbiont of Ctena orbiculata]|nr:ADP-forming succinate--CoA ligase subunit beta [Candidatus Thiodiazotropha taylori]PVV10828.1 MAG: succinate--CoA ligase subunit beta [gamma proteobacterium symbiont of Ctena orbiculata]MBT2998612.1 ADP-forming succinate--CoA ligase subunit beta [Candidatus Thiodiazotropha taylori]MBT3001472.1 ADP-forming succinate--CoA ligase subunit beta [Candidatus Thiodiazotropha taylori]MBV2106090.1 ADP-forming succinate--CoA ligase subunit beta [Candidatus Thiodiazotropha taylori]
MNIHEYQTKELFRSYKIPVPEGGMAHSANQALSVAEQLGGDGWVVKAQIHAGGRGKAGGVQLARTLEEVQNHAESLIGSRLITRQTGEAGRLVNRVLVEQIHQIDREYYLGIVIDRGTQRITLIASAAGGMEIEEVAKHSPEKVIREIVDPAVGLQDFQCRKVAAGIGVGGKEIGKLGRIMKRLYRCFRDNDALMVEINPLVRTGEGEFLALDAKMTFDGNALFRQGDIADLRDFDEEDPKEVEASGHDLNYIALDGSVGCIVNGAGLAMATMDAISLYGGRPANFLDVGGGASPEKIANAFRIVLEDPNVKVVLLNIYAGINRCDWIAEGIVKAMAELTVEVPVVVRLAGTNLEAGREILVRSGLDYIHADRLSDAAEKSVEAIREVVA